MRSCFDNPIFNRTLQVEHRKIGSGPKAWIRRCGMAGLIWLLPMVFLTLFNLENLTLRPHEFYGLIQVSVGVSTFFTLLHGISKATHGTLNGICLEKEQKTYESLQSTLLSPQEIVGGKLLTGLWPTARDLAVTFPFALLMGLAGHQARAVLGCYAVITATSLVLGCIGLVCSYRAASIQIATQQSTLWVA